MHTAANVRCLNPMEANYSMPGKFSIIICYFLNEMKNTPNDIEFEMAINDEINIQLGV